MHEYTVSQIAMHEAGWKLTVEYMHTAAGTGSEIQIRRSRQPAGWLAAATNIKNAQEAKLQGRPSVRTLAIASPTQIFDPETR